MIGRLGRRAAFLTVILVTAVLLGLLVVKVISGARHTSATDTQNTQLIGTLQGEIHHVNLQLALFAAELTRIASEKHADPRLIARLQHQIELLSRETGRNPAPTPTATVTETRTAPPQPRQTITVTPSCRGVTFYGGGCVPAKVPTSVPSIGLP